MFFFRFLLNFLEPFMRLQLDVEPSRTVQENAKNQTGFNQNRSVLGLRFGTQFNAENAKEHCFLVAAILFFIGKIIII